MTDVPEPGARQPRLDHSRLRTCVAAGLLLLGLSAPASADWYVAPFLGVTFGDTPFIDLDGAAGRAKRTFGGTVTLVSDKGFGVEGEVAFSPGFFQRGRALDSLISQSRVVTLMGNMVFAAPERLTRYALRPYVSGGVGLMSTHVVDQLGLFSDTNMFAMNAGGGAIGFLTERTGVKWDLRLFRNLSVPDPRAVVEGARLRYWRASIAVVLKY